MRIDLGRFIQKQKGNLRAFSRKLPVPIRRELFYARGLASGPLGLPRSPWCVAEADPPDTETVAEFDGEFEPQRKAVFYGADDAPSRLSPRPRVTRLRLRRFENVVLLPHRVVLRQSDRAILPVTYELTGQSRWLSSASGRAGYANYNFDGDVQPPRIVEEPVFFADSLYPIFGHTLMDVVPTLPMLAGAPADIKIASSAPLYRALFEGSGVAMERMLPFRGPLFCKTVFIPDPPLDLEGSLHTVARQAFAKLEQLAALSSIEPVRRVFLSRAKVPIRRLENEIAVEQMFAERGFAIIHPQDLSIPDQVKLMLNADMVAGPVGSNMHNLVYARPDTKALLLSSKHWFNDIDRYVSKADWQFAYVIGEPRPGQWREPHSWSWTIDLATVETAIHQHLGL